MLRPVILSVFLFALLITFTGCAEQPSAEQSPSHAGTDPVTDDSQEPSEPAAAPADNSSAPAEKVELEVVTFDELQDSIAASKGKVVVVDYWSTFCPPCMTEFPGLVAIHNDFPPEHVRCISASLDYEGLADYPVEEARKSALEFLKQQNATLDNFILSEDSLTVMDEKLKIASIPAVFVFGTDGKLARLFDESSGESFTYEKDVTPFVKELVSQSFSEESTTADNE